MVARQIIHRANRYLHHSLCIVVFLIGSAATVFACICGKASTCELYNSSTLVFVGKAVAIEQATNGSFKTETTVFEIKEMFLGDISATVRVRTKSGFSCDVEFTVGETYLVFAGGSKTDGFGTGFCSGNLPMEYASEPIAELRKLSGSNGDGRLAGTVLEEFNRRSGEEKREPIKDVKLEITEILTGRKYTANTNTVGRFDIAVPPGRYTVSPVPPAGSVLNNLFSIEPMDIRSSGCAESFLVLANNSSLSGRLLDADGRPVPHARVELVSMDADRSYLGGESGETDIDGTFSIEQVPIGKYTLSINFNSNPDPERPFPTTFYPAATERISAHIFEIGLGSKIEDISWRLPPKLGETIIEGEVLWEDGTPAQFAEIKLFDMAFPGFYAGCFLLESRNRPENLSSPVRSVSMSMKGSACNLKSDASGKFRLSAYAGRTYRVKASAKRTTLGAETEYSGQSDAFKLGTEPPSLRIQLKRTK